MLRVNTIDNRKAGIPPVSTTVVVCDGCGETCEESKVYDADHGAAIGWNGGSALAAAKYAGWTQEIEGRMARDYCPSCSVKPVE